LRCAGQPDKQLSNTRSDERCVSATAALIENCEASATIDGWQQAVAILQYAGASSRR